MPNIFLLPIMLLLVVLPFFIAAEYRRDIRRSLPLKMTCSLCFLGAGILGVTLGNATRLGGYHGLMIAGLVLSLLGDLALVWQDRPRAFLIGLSSFLLGHILFCAAFCLVNGFSPWDVLLFACIVGLSLLAHRSLDMDLGKMKRAVLAYLLVISFMLTKALSTLYLGGLEGAAAWMVPLGGALFFLSDGFLALYKFLRRPSRAFRGMNLTAYYAAQMLLAISLFFS